MAAMAAKVVLEAVKRGTEHVPDHYWDRVPGMRPPKTEKEYKETKAKVDANEAKYGRFGSEKRRRGDKDRYGREMAERRRNDKDGSGDHDRHRHRRRSQSDERRADRRRDRDVRAQRRGLERRASSYSPPPPEDKDFYNDAERLRQDRRAEKYFCNDPSHQRWERRDQPAPRLDRPYIPMPQASGPMPGPTPGAVPGPPTYTQSWPAPPSGGATPRNSASPYNPGVSPPAMPYGQAGMPPPPPRAGIPRPPVSFAQYQSPPDSQRSSMHSASTFSPQSSSPYTPASASNSRPSSQMHSYSRPTSPQAQNDPYVQNPAATLSPQAPQSPISEESKAAQKYTPAGMVNTNLNAIYSTSQQ